MKKKCTPGITTAIIAMARGGLAYKEIAKAVSMSISVVNTIALNAGIMRNFTTRKYCTSKGY